MEEMKNAIARNSLKLLEVRTILVEFLLVGPQFL